MSDLGGFAVGLVFELGDLLSFGGLFGGPVGLTGRLWGFFGLGCGLGGARFGSTGARFGGCL